MAIFVDGANLFYCQRDRLRWWIDWKRLLTHFQRDCDVVEAFYYRADAGKGSDDFVKMLVSSGYTLRGKPLMEVTDESSGQVIKKGNMDVELVIDALNASARYDTCLLISGDGDFVPLVEALRHRGKAVLVLSTSGSAAFELRSAVGLNFHDLRTLRSDIEYLPPPSPTESVPDIGNAGQHQDVVAGSEIGGLAEGIDGPTIVRSTAVEAESEVETMVEAVVARYSGGGVVLTTEDGVDLYLPVTNLRLAGFVSDLPALIQIGERFSVVAVGLDERRSPPTKIVSLANDAERDRLQQRLDELAPSLDDLPSEGEFDLDVQAVKPFGAFLRNPWHVPVLLHVSGMNIGHVPDCTRLIHPGERVRVRVTGREQHADGPRVNTELADDAYRQKLLARSIVVPST